MSDSRPLLAVTGPLIPCDQIRARGFEPVAPTPRARGAAAGVCAVAQGWAEAVAAEGEAWSGAVVTTRCDQLRRAAEALRERTRVPLFVMNVPATHGTPAAEQLYAAELERLDAFLERLPRRPPLRPRAAAPSAAPGPAAQGWRVGLFGCCVTDADRAVLGLLARAGLCVVLDATERVPVARPTIGQRPNAALFAWLDRCGREARLDGWVLLRQPWCDLIRAEEPRLKSATQLPWLVLETGERPALAALRTRAEAFAELLAQSGRRRHD